MPPLPTADLASGMTAAFGICAAVLGRGTTRRGHLPRRLHDRRPRHVDGPCRCRRSAQEPDGVSPPGRTAVPGYGLFATADEGQIALGRGQRAALLVPPVPGPRSRRRGWTSDFASAARTGRELQHTIARAVAHAGPDALVAELAAAGVPAAPVLDRPGDAGRASFPALPHPAPAPPCARCSAGARPTPRRGILRPHLTCAVRSGCRPVTP